GKLAVCEKQMLASPDQQISPTDPDSSSVATSGRGSGVVGYTCRSPSTPSRRETVQDQPTCHSKANNPELAGLSVDSLLNDYRVVYSTIAVTWGRTPAGGFNWTDAARSSAYSTSLATLSVSTAPLTVAGIVGGT